MIAISAGRPGTANIERDGKGSRASETLTIYCYAKKLILVLPALLPRARHPIVDFLLRGDIIILCHAREP